MKELIDIPDYDPREGIVLRFEGDYRIKLEITGDHEVLLSANKDGLVSLATHLLTLAQDAVPANSEHFHLTEDDALEDGSVELIVQKMD